MTIYNLNVILTAAKLESISAAAKELNISQPNASSCIKAVEKEVGYEIFERKKGGVTPSPNGKLFLEHAKRILEENKKIMLISQENEFRQMRVGITHFSRGYSSFVSFYKQYEIEHPDNANTDFQCFFVTVTKGFQLLSSREIDVFVNLNFDEDEPRMKNICKEQGFRKILVGKIQGVLNFRKDHPVLKDISSINNAQHSEILRKYPFVYYSTFKDSSGSFFTYNVDDIPCSTRIMVDNAETRFKLIENTDAFGSGCAQTKEILNKYGIVAIPIEGLFFNVNCFVREKDNNPDVKKYIEIFTEELKKA